jgi:aminoglycoside N3'-acetyltransferase
LHFFIDFLFFLTYNQAEANVLKGYHKMKYSKEQIKRGLHDLGICPGDVILMHSSFKSLGELDGGAKT